MSRLPEHAEGEGIRLRRWRPDDAESLHQAVLESAEHLRPWMSWMNEEPHTIEQRRAMLARWEQEWSDGGDVLLGIFVGGAVAGSCGLHRRGAPDTLEIGYWTHVSFLRLGLAAKAAAVLTDTAFALSEIARVETHHDQANLVSAAVPRRLGYRFVGEHADGVRAPAECGIECIWRLERDQWIRPGR